MSNIAALIAAAQSAPAFFDKNSKIGDRFYGPIVSVDLRQTRDPKDNKPQTWEDGSPMQQLVIIVEDGSGEVDEKGETAMRTVYVKWWGEQRKAFAKAIFDAGAEEPLPGGVLSVEYVGDGPKPKNKALNATKLYEYVYNTGTN